MADIKVSAMSPDASPSLDDILMTIDTTSGANKKVLLSALATLMGQNLPAGGIDANDINWTTAGEIWWEELGRTTLGSANHTITIQNLTGKKYLLVFITLLQTGGTINGNFTFNNDTGSNYSNRNSTDGAADATQTSQAAMFGTNTATAQTDKFSVHEIVNIASKEKLVISRAIAGQTGAANAPTKRENVAKWANTSNQITRIDIVNTGTGDFAAGSEVIVLGHD